MRSSNVIAVIPGYNEERAIGDVIRKTKKYVKKVIVIDDGSDDNTSAVARRAGADVIAYKRNRGKGHALRIGLKRAIERKADVIVMLDSDGQHDPAEIPKLLKEINDSLIIGSRFMGRIATRKRNIFGNIGLTFGINVLSFGLNMKKWITDTQSGYKAIRSESLKKMKLKAERFEIDGEMILEAARKGIPIKEVPIMVTKKVHGVTIADGLRAAWFVFLRRMFG